MPAEGFVHRAVGTGDRIDCTRLCVGWFATGSRLIRSRGRRGQCQAKRIPPIESPIRNARQISIATVNSVRSLPGVVRRRLCVMPLFPVAWSLRPFDSRNQRTPRGSARELRGRGASSWYRRNPKCRRDRSSCGAASLRESRDGERGAALAAVGVTALVDVGDGVPAASRSHAPAPPMRRLNWLVCRPKRLPDFVVFDVMWFCHLQSHTDSRGVFPRGSFTPPVSGVCVALPHTN